MDVTGFGKAVVLFAQRENCVPCQRFKPHYELVSEKLPEIWFGVAYLDESPEFAEYARDVLNVLSTPSVLYYEDMESDVRWLVGRTAPVLLKELS